MAQSSSSASQNASHQQTLADHFADVRETWCSCHPKCRYTWLFTILGGCYFYIASQCALLTFRLMLHMGLVMGGLLGFMICMAYCKMKKVVDSPHPTRKAVVRRLKTLPRHQIHPNLRQKLQKVIASIEWLEEDGQSATVNSLEEKESSSTPGNNLPSESTNHNEQNGATLDENEDDGLPKVLLNADDCVVVGDTLTLSLLDGDANRPFHMPYQKAAVQNSFWKMIKAVSAVAVVLLVLRFSMPGLPIFFASSEQVEAYFRSCWFCQWPLDDEEDGATGDAAAKQEYEIETQLQDCCSIPWTVTWAYNIFLIALATFFCALFGYVRWITRRAVNAEYRRLRNDATSDDPTGVAMAVPRNQETEPALV